MIKPRLFNLLVPLTIILAACSLNTSLQTEGDQKETQVEKLPVLGNAPELENEIWLNTEKSLRLSDLEGRVVLLEMWTYG